MQSRFRMQGALRGIGRQAQLMLFNAMGFWATGVTSGLLLTFALHLRLVGLWLGIVIGIGATCAMNLIALARVEWAAEAARATAAAAAAAAASGAGMLAGGGGDLGGEGRWEEGDLDGGYERRLQLEMANVGGAG